MMLVDSRFSNSCYSGTWILLSASSRDFLFLKIQNYVKVERIFNILPLWYFERILGLNFPIIKLLISGGFFLQKYFKPQNFRLEFFNNSIYLIL